MTVDALSAKSTAEAKLNQGLPSTRNQNDVIKLVNSVLGVAFRSVENSEKEQVKLKRQLSLVLHPDRMSNEWKDHLMRIHTPIEVPFKLLDGYEQRSKVVEGFKDPAAGFTLSTQWMVDGLVNTGRYPQPFKFFARFILIIVDLAVMISLIASVGVIVLITHLKNLFVNAITNVATVGGLNQQFRDYKNNFPVKYEVMRTSVLTQMRDTEIESLKMRLKIARKDSEASARVISDKLSEINNLTPDQYEELLNAREQPEATSIIELSEIKKSVGHASQQMYVSKLEYMIRNKGFNPILLTARAISESVTKPLPESSLLKPFAIALRGLQFLTCVALVMPLTIINWVANNLIHLAMSVVASAIMLAAAAVNVAINLPLIAKDIVSGSVFTQHTEQQPANGRANVTSVAGSRYSSFAKATDPAAEERLRLANSPGAISE